MIPAAFDYVRADSSEAALAALAEHGDDAKVLAGGMSLIPLMRLRLAVPAVVVDVGRVRELSYVRDGGDHLAIGALTRHRDVETSPLVQAECPPLAGVTAEVGDLAVRNRGTIGGAASHGDPASDLPAALLTLEATILVQGVSGERAVAASDFFRGFLETALEPDELVTEIRVPKIRSWSYQKLNVRSQDWAIVGVLATRDTAGATRVGLVNMGATPLRAQATEDALASGVSIAEAAAHAGDGTNPPADVRASAEFRSHLVRVLVRRSLEEIGAVETT